MKTLCTILICQFFVALGYCSELEIINFKHSGELEWRSEKTGGTYRVQWSSTPGTPWKDGWDELSAIVSTDALNKVRVPLVYRILWSPLTSVEDATCGVLNAGATVLFGHLDDYRLRTGSILFLAGPYYLYDAGDGMLHGNSTVTGLINYENGTWEMDFGGQSSVTDLFVVAKQYKYQEDDSVRRILNETNAVGVGPAAYYTGVLSNKPIVENSVSFVAGLFYISDDGCGNLTNKGSGVHGIINYDTGFWLLDFLGYRIDAGVPITANYLIKYTGEP